MQPTGGTIMQPTGGTIMQTTGGHGKTLLRAALHGLLAARYTKQHGKAPGAQRVRYSTRSESAIFYLLQASPWSEASPLFHLLQASPWSGASRPLGTAAAPGSHPLMSGFESRATSYAGSHPLSSDGGSVSASRRHLCSGA
jgi:hypothetical protein